MFAITNHSKLRMECPDYTGSPASNMLELKVSIKSIISDANKGARFCTVDITNFFLASAMRRAEYTKVKYKHLPEDIRAR